MTNDNEPLWLLAIKGAGALVALVLALGVAFIIGAFVWGLGVGMYNGVVKSFEVTPEEKARIEKENKDWETDARNPKIAGQACIDKGGIPRYSNWDGEVFRCDIIEDKK
jgi:hypothetical protein